MRLYSEQMRQMRFEMKDPFNRLLTGFLTALVLGLPASTLAQDEDYGYGYEYLVAEEKPKEGRTVLFTPKHISVAQLRPALQLILSLIHI